MFKNCICFSVAEYQGCSVCTLRFETKPELLWLSYRKQEKKERLQMGFECNGSEKDPDDADSVYFIIFSERGAI